ncbi:MAG: group II intron reverse transcriptase/maturase [Candidatus Polarisedimenticolaceae bacterium]|nr:group II intron reverse transcriptase/maturase [Candidatus Polarisedimenticolaceae bacterium]
MGETDLSAILDYANLHQAWNKVRENSGCAGTDNQTIPQFNHNLQVNLHALTTEVNNKTYRPQPLLGVTIYKPGKNPRKLAIPAVRDRVLQTTVALHLQPLLEKEFEQSSFGYRPGLSVDMAVRQVIRYREQGYTWVVDADIKSYFDEIDHTLLLLELSRHIQSSSIIQLIRTWLRTPIQDEESSWTPIKGVPQGSPLSPLLANLYLDWFDEQLQAEEQRLVRFADDFLILCKNRAAAEEALELTDDLLNALTLELNEEKTSVTNFDKGFRFLGVLFLRSIVMKSKANHEPQHANPSQATRKQIQPQPTTDKSPEQNATAPLAETECIAVPPAQNTPTAEDPESTAANNPILRTLYISEYSARLSKEGETLLVHKDGKLLQRVPLRRVDQIILFGNIQMTTQFITGCLQRNTPITLLSRSGHFHGIIDSFSAGNSDLQRHQLTAADSTDRRLQLARGMVLGKLRNSRVILGRYARKRKLLAFDKATIEINRLITSLETCQKLESVRGFEGMAANHYFQAWRTTLNTQWNFTGRKRRPPPDPINALLSFGYTLLFHNVFSLLRTRGLNTHIGFLHAERAGHPALASDIMEEFRAPIIDATVLSLIFNNRITPDDFTENDQGGCQISNSARKTFIRAIEAKMNSQLIHPHSGHKIDYRRCIDQQIHRLITTLRDPATPYHAFVIR